MDKKSSDGNQAGNKDQPMKLEVEWYEDDKVIKIERHDYYTASLACEAFTRIAEHCEKFGKNVLLILRDKKLGYMITNKRICPDPSSVPSAESQPKETPENVQPTTKKPEEY